LQRSLLRALSNTDRLAEHTITLRQARSDRNPNFK